MATEDPKSSLKAMSRSADEQSILLLDANDRSRESRAQVLRDRSLNVDCAATAEQARALWSLRSYGLASER